MKSFAKSLAAAVEMGADGVEGEGEGVGDLFVGALLLVKEDEDGSLDE